jgi:hypothetical protein
LKLFINQLSPNKKILVHIGYLKRITEQYMSFLTDQFKSETTIKVTRY